MLTLAASHAAALGLGEHDLQSNLGQALRLVVNVIGEGDEGVGCYRISSATRNFGDGVPQLTQGDLRIDPTPGRTRLIISSRRIINDPVLRVVVEAGCQSSISRDYVLLLDPATFSSDVPVIAEARPPQRAADTPSAAQAAAAPAPSGATSEEAPPRPKAKKTRAAKAPSNKAALAPQPHAASATATASGPRLEVSRTQSIAPPPVAAATPANTLQAEAEATRAVEEEMVVLQKRIAYLKESLARLQALDAAAKARASPASAPDPAVGQPSADATATMPKEPAVVAATEPAPKAAVVADSKSDAPAEDTKSTLGAKVGGLFSASKKTAEAALPPAGYSGWLWSFLALLALALAFTYYVWRRGRDRSNAMLINVRASRYGEPAKGAPAKHYASDYGPPSEIGDTIDTHPWERRDQQVMVTELSATHPEHVTEQANLFARLGHHEQAIAVLREYVEQQGVTSPAPLLMLLDLYRDSADRAEYERLSSQLKSQFNVRTPSWDEAQSDAANDAANEAGLEGYPHVISKLTKLWGTRACMDYMQTLVVDSRGGTRVGFSLPVYFDILFLMRVQDDVLRHSDQADLDWGLHERAQRAGAA
jgi:hypothetical protein